MAALQPVSPGQRLRISASDYNAILDTTRAFQLRQRSMRAGEPVSPDAGMVPVRNDSGAHRDALEVLGLDVPLILPTESLDAWRSRVMFSGIAPLTAHAGRFCILQEPIPNGGMGRAMIIGITPVILNVVSESHRFAEVDNGVATSLKTGVVGSARILWKETGTGSKRGVVMLSGEAPAGGAVHEATANPTVNDDSGDGYIIGTVWVNTTTDKFFVAADVTVGAAVWIPGVSKPTEDGTVFCSKSDSSDGEWVMTIDIGRNATGKAGKIQILSPNASGVAVEIDAALVTSAAKKLTIREVDICDSGTMKKVLRLESAPY